MGQLITTLHEVGVLTATPKLSVQGGKFWVRCNRCGFGALFINDLLAASVQVQAPGAAPKHAPVPHRRCMLRCECNKQIGPHSIPYSPGEQSAQAPAPRFVGIPPTTPPTAINIA
jgi:hypothetical protein